MTEGRYIYCILDAKANENPVITGILNKNIFRVRHKDITAIVSTLPYKEIQANVENIATHQQVVEASRGIGTVLPVRFGIIVKTDEGVKKLLVKSYKEFKSKINRLRDKDEFGVKVVLDNKNIKKLHSLVQENSEEIKSLKNEIGSAKDGTAYFLKLRMEDAVKNEMLKKIDKISGDVHKELSNLCVETCLLKTDLKQIILNASYLVNREDGERFVSRLKDFKQIYRSSGLIFHVSGPWAPYSFC